MKLKDRVRETFVDYLSRVPISSDNDRYSFRVYKRKNNDFYWLDYKFGSLLSRVFVKYFHKEKTLDIIFFNLYEKHHGYGIGQKMLWALEMSARELGARKIQIINSTNDSFWEHMGYQKIRKKRNTPDGQVNLEKLLYF